MFNVNVLWCEKHILLHIFNVIVKMFYHYTFIYLFLSLYSTKYSSLGVWRENRYHRRFLKFTDLQALCFQSNNAFYGLRSTFYGRFVYSMYSGTNSFCTFPFRMERFYSFVAEEMVCGGVKVLNKSGFDEKRGQFEIVIVLFYFHYYIC